MYNTILCIVQEREGLGSEGGPDCEELVVDIHNRRWRIKNKLAWLLTAVTTV